MCESVESVESRGVSIGRTPELFGLKILKGNGRGNDIAGRPIPTPAAFERGIPDCPAWLSPGA